MRASDGIPGTTTDDNDWSDVSKSCRMSVCFVDASRTTAAIDAAYGRLNQQKLKIRAAESIYALPSCQRYREVDKLRNAP